MWEEIPKVADLRESLAEPSNPIGMRMRAAYYLRHHYSTDEERQKEVVDILSKELLQVKHGSLMRHEFAYIMGQIRDERCCDVLEDVVQRSDDCIMVRHEAAEALGAIGANRSTPVLQKVVDENPGKPELEETCQIALHVMKWRADGGDPENLPAACACMLNPYSSVDPAPPHPSHANKNFEELGDILCNPDLPMFERYRAMFSLRNRGGAEAVSQLCRALIQDTSSALLRHECAYVLGQMQHPDSVEALEESLRRVDEHMMVRHESAEALGAIDGRWEDVEKTLTEFTRDQNEVVRDSCLVALDAADYWGHSRDQDHESDDRESTFSEVKHQPVLVNHFNIQA